MHVYSKPVDSDSATEGSAAEDESVDVGPSQQRAFDLLKDELSKTPVLALCDTTRDTTMSAEASLYELGVVLQYQRHVALGVVRLESDDADRGAILAD